MKNIQIGDYVSGLLVNHETDTNSLARRSGVLTHLVPLGAVLDGGACKYLCDPTTLQKTEQPPTGDGEEITGGDDNSPNRCPPNGRKRRRETRSQVISLHDKRRR